MKKSIVLILLPSLIKNLFVRSFVHMERKENGNIFFSFFSNASFVFPLCTWSEIFFLILCCTVCLELSPLRS